MTTELNEQTIEKLDQVIDTFLRMEHGLSKTPLPIHDLRIDHDAYVRHRLPYDATQAQSVLYAMLGDARGQIAVHQAEKTNGRTQLTEIDLGRNQTEFYIEKDGKTQNGPLQDAQLRLSLAPMIDDLLNMRDTLEAVKNNNKLRLIQLERGKRIDTYPLDRIARATSLLTHLNDSVLNGALFDGRVLDKIPTSLERLGEVRKDIIDAGLDIPRPSYINRQSGQVTHAFEPDAKEQESGNGQGMREAINRIACRTNSQAAGRS